MDPSNRVAIITGAASGIGAACARAFAAKGAKVAVIDLNATGASEIAREIGGLAIPCDIGSEAQINALVAQTQRELGPVEVFFSNAGVASGADALTTPVDVWNEQWQIDAGSLGLFDHGVRIVGNRLGVLLRDDHRRAGEGDQIFRLAWPPQCSDRLL
jgi:NAD(P)-dependent dehydrogenase (short-subunit alcohol dehydrogenase family)